MAEAAVSFAVEKLGNLLIEKVAFLRGVEGQVKWLKDELEMMQSFLKDAAEKQAEDERFRHWLSGIRDVAHDAEDAVEIFVLNAEKATIRSRGRLLGRCASIPKHVYHLYRDGTEIESIRARIQDIERSRLRDMIQDQGERVGLTRRPENVELQGRLAPWGEDKDVVGLEEDVKLLLEKAVLEERAGLSVVAIVGMGGIGKSTLARKIYNHKAVADRFECRAWVVVSSEFAAEDIVKQILLQLRISRDRLKEVESMNDKLRRQEMLMQMLQIHLVGKRYFIVLDDVWEDSHWRSLQMAFPDEQDTPSRVVLTSRNRVITKYTRYVHEMKLLDREQSRQLLLKKAFVDKGKGACPPDLEDIERKISEKCGGLPLAISMVGGLLAKQTPSRSEWEKVLNGINSRLGRIENNVSAVLQLSYQNLPPRLKSCFLCLSFFREDAAVRAEKLVQVWIAQGLVPQDTTEETMEDIAASYLEELINRSMVQIKDFTKDGRAKNCLIHDLVRELSIIKAKEEIGFMILKEDGYSQFSRKPRHLAMYCSGGRFIDSTNQNKFLRSLFVHGDGKVTDSPSYWKSFELLRVLDFEDFGLQILPETIGVLIGLRYLGLRNNKMRRLPRSLRRLKNLEVLDIALNLMIEVPSIVWKMSSLRHLYMSGIRCKKPLKMDMKNLQTLLYIPVAYWKPEQMTSLKKLGIELDENSDISELCESLAKVQNLVCLKLRGSFDKSMGPLSGLGIVRGLTKLKLHGWLSKLPNASDFPPNLSCLSLVETYLDEDPMPILEKLPELMYLQLHQAYTGDKMGISNGKFPKLEVLSLRRLLELRNLEVGEGALPELKRLEIDLCPQLETLPEQVRSVTSSKI